VQPKKIDVEFTILKDASNVIGFIDIVKVLQLLEKSNDIILSSYTGKQNNPGEAFFKPGCQHTGPIHYLLERHEHIEWL
jgi:hypothetical protein